MKKWKYFLYADPNMGWGVGETVYYIEAPTKEKAKEKLKMIGMKHDPDFIDGDVEEVEEFKQPRKIPII